MVAPFHATRDRNLLLLSTAHDIWTTAKHTYSRVGNDAQVYELRKKTHELLEELTISAHL